jgi:predicted amidohydrolase YtcJ
VRPVDRTPELVVVGGAVEAVAGPFAEGGAEALAVVDGRFTAVGSSSEIRGMAGQGTRVVELQGQSVVPGFIDAHVHPIDGGMTRQQCDLYELSGVDAYLRAIADYAAAHPERAWITGGGWSLPDFPGGNPRKEQLDAVVPDRPVMLYNRDGHDVWVNSAALGAAGIDRLRARRRPRAKRCPARGGRRPRG